MQNGNLAAKFEENVKEAFDLSNEEFLQGGGSCRKDEACPKGYRCDKDKGSPSYNSCIEKKQAKLNPPFEFDEAVKEELGESLEHGKSCRNDSACPRNTHCNTNRGTSNFHTCVNDVDNLPIEVDDDEGDKCGAYCTSDSQCMSPPGAPHNACGKCGMYSGTQMYRRCYSPEPVVTPKPTPSPTPW